MAVVVPWASNEILDAPATGNALTGHQGGKLHLDLTGRRNVLPAFDGYKDWLVRHQAQFGEIYGDDPRLGSLYPLISAAIGMYGRWQHDQVGFGEDIASNGRAVAVAD